MARWSSEDGWSNAGVSSRDSGEERGAEWQVPIPTLSNSAKFKLRIQFGAVQSLSETLVLSRQFHHVFRPHSL